MGRKRDNSSVTIVCCSCCNAKQTKSLIGNPIKNYATTGIKGVCGIHSRRAMRYRLTDPCIGGPAKGPSKYLKLERSRPGELRQRHDERAARVLAVDADRRLKSSTSIDQRVKLRLSQSEVRHGLSNHPSTRSSLRNNSRMDLPLDLLC